MKTRNILVAIALLIGAVMVSLNITAAINQYNENSKDHKAACLMSDAIRCYMDNLSEMRKESPESADLREAENALEEILGIYIWDEEIKLEDYVWAY